MSKHHDLLGISPDATQEQIRAAYKLAAQREHPDRGGEVAKFQAIKRAYEFLRDSAPCEVCGGTGFTTEKRGFFTKTIQCPKCWKLP